MGSGVPARTTGEGDEATEIEQHDQRRDKTVPQSGEGNQ